LIIGGVIDDDYLVFDICGMPVDAGDAPPDIFGGVPVDYYNR